MLEILLLVTVLMAGVGLGFMHAQRQAFRRRVVAELARPETPRFRLEGYQYPEVSVENIDQILAVEELDIAAWVASQASGIPVTETLEPYRHFRRLRCLSLWIGDYQDRESVGPLSPYPLAILREFPSLTELEIESDLPPDLHQLGTWPQLEALAIAAHHERPQNWPDLRLVQGFPNLRRLTFRNVSINDWSGLTALQRLEELNYECAARYIAGPWAIQRPSREVPDQIPSLRKVRFKVR
ncbi:MAG TPA: hypothetical protein VEI97_20220, partial [bacterium]|nr:hypothetical protein [bacterium]